MAERIGKGAYGGVWKAKLLQYDKDLGPEEAMDSDVVVKVVRPDRDLDPEEAAKSKPCKEKLASFRREIAVMSELGTTARAHPATWRLPRRQWPRGSCFLMW